MSEAQLRDRIEYLEAENANLRDLLTVSPDTDFIRACRAALRLTPSSAKVLQIMMFGRRTSKLAILHAYYDGNEGDRDTKLIDVQVCHVRKALKPHGVAIETVWGDGYRIAADDKSRVLSILGIEAKP